MSDEMKEKIRFIENELPKLMSLQPSMKGLKTLICSAQSKTHLDGFMSSIFTAELETEDAGGK